MPGPLRKDTPNQQSKTPVLENTPQLRLRPPASNTSDPGDMPADDGLWVRSGGVEREHDD